MGYAFGLNNNGREIGYGVEATCDLDGCEETIDRGLAYCCGGMAGVQNGGMDDEPYCGDYFCAKHLFYIYDPDEVVDSGSVCVNCHARLKCEACGGEGHDADGELCEACDSHGHVAVRAAA